MRYAAAIDALKNILPAKSWSQNKDILAPYLCEWRDRWQGQAPILLRPANTEEVAIAVRICAAHKTPITIQGGNTGLVGGQIPQGEVLLSTIRLNKIRATNADNLHMICEAGVTLQAVQEAADMVGLKFPLSLASEGSCTIGGNLSTNAGGVHVVKYGTTRQLVYGAEAVLADGSLYDGLNPLRKDNTGYDLSQLLMGAEGTLGIITAASVKLFPKPKDNIRVMAAVESPAKALQLLNMVRGGYRLCMFELIPRLGMDYATQMPGHKDPFTAKYPWYVLLEWEFDDSEIPQDFAQKTLEIAVERGLVLDAVIATSEAQSGALLALRENLSASQKPIGATIKHDISVPTAKVPDFIALANAAVTKHTPNCRPLPFGHLGDGNIHYNIGQPEVMQPDAFMALEPEINDIVYDIVDSLGGSISAEHGIGILKKGQLSRRASPAKLQMMRQIKTALDPDNILNPSVLL
ncbi:MAG: FAD-binding oxidoreductase [Robiginitomaculum sp.]|nr:FAD-binding oxidoreductase [Robiginitomaculum sp.]